jgi:hypothetical protein
MNYDGFCTNTYLSDYCLANSQPQTHVTGVGAVSLADDAVCSLFSRGKMVPRATSVHYIYNSDRKRAVANVSGN